MSLTHVKRNSQLNTFRSESGILDSYSPDVHTSPNEATKLLLQGTTDFPEKLLLFSLFQTLCAAHCVHQYLVTG